MNRVIGNPAGTHGLYSPVPTLATLLVLEENLFGLMGSLAFEQRARPLALLLDHLTGPEGEGEPVLAHSPTGGFWYGEGERGGEGGRGGNGKTFPAQAEARAPVPPGIAIRHFGKTFPARAEAQAPDHPAVPYRNRACPPCLARPRQTLSRCHI
jgi:hypothetical protein